MKSRKLVLSIILLIAFTLSLAACGQDQGTGTDKGSESKGTIAVLNYVSSAPYFACGEEKAIQAGKDAGYDVIYTGTPEVDTPKFISLIQDMIQKDVKALCVASGDSTSVVPVLKEAREKGIKVVSWDLDVAEEGRDLYAGIMDLAELGVPMVEEMVKTIGDEGEFAIITGVLTNEFLQARINRILEYIEEKYPKLECVAVEGMDEDPEKCFAVAQNIIAAYPNIKAIMSNVSTGMGPIGKAIEQEGMIGKIYVTGQSTPNLAKPVFESGAAESAVLWDPGDWAAFAVKAAINLVEGADMPQGKVNIEGFPDATREGDLLYFWKTLVFTKDNVDDFDF
ncbi:MAG: substrate-binding domain-containing protein [Caldicoprobacterales bacterium]|jgi:rhamnose transport system substrate-binding protein|nr:substrate-binding domain-containing protein [Clostridiales bacterium]